MYRQRDGVLVLEGPDHQMVKFIQEWLGLYHDPATPLLLLNVNDRIAGLPAVVGMAAPLPLAEAIFNAAVADANGHRDRNVGYQLCLTAPSDPLTPCMDKPRLNITVDRDGKECFCAPRNAEVKEVVHAPPTAPSGS